MTSSVFSLDQARAFLARLLLVCLLPLMLAACGDLPRPFKHDRLAAAANPLVALRSGTGVTVEHALGLPVPWNRLVALEMAEMLRDRGIPAEAGGGGGLGHRLSLRVDKAEGRGDPGKLPLETTWRLAADDGTVLAGNVTRTDVDSLTWERAAPESARDFGGVIVAAVADALGGGGWAPSGPSSAAAPPPSPRAAPSGAVSQTPLAAPPTPAAPAASESGRAPPPSVAAERPTPPTPAKVRAKAPDGSVVMALTPVVSEAPGTGVEELEKAMATLIRAAGMPVTADPEKASLAITGKVLTTPVAGEKEKVELIWVVTDPKTGKEIGTVRQENFVPKGMLDGTWGRLAYQIAQAALEGVGDILTRPAQ